jgi:hypothetical protein
MATPPPSGRLLPHAVARVLGELWGVLKVTTRAKRPVWDILRGIRTAVILSKRPVEPFSVVVAGMADYGGAGVKEHRWRQPGLMTQRARGRNRRTRHEQHRICTAAFEYTMSKPHPGQQPRSPLHKGGDQLVTLLRLIQQIFSRLCTSTSALQRDCQIDKRASRTRAPSWCRPKISCFSVLDSNFCLRRSLGVGHS